MIAWFNAGMDDSDGYQYWLRVYSFQPWNVSSNVSVSGSHAKGWRVWALDDPPGGGKCFDCKRFAFEYAEQLRL